MRQYHTCTIQTQFCAGRIWLCQWLWPSAVHCQLTNMPMSFKWQLNDSEATVLRGYLLIRVYSPEIRSLKHTKSSWCDCQMKLHQKRLQENTKIICQGGMGLRSKQTLNRGRMKNGASLLQQAAFKLRLFFSSFRSPQPINFTNNSLFYMCVFSYTLLKCWLVITGWEKNMILEKSERPLKGEQSGSTFLGDTHSMEEC